MGKVEEALRDLIQYHSRREARNLFGDTEDDVKELKREVRELRNVLDDVVDKVDELYEAHQQQMDIPPADEEKTEQARVTSRTIQSVRDRYDLTQQELADLLDVSMGTITSWENGKSKPRSSNKARVVTLREMSKEQVDEILGREDEPHEFTPEVSRQFRENYQLTQKELGGLLGVSETTVYHWENGETTPGSETLDRLYELTDMDETEIHKELARNTDRYNGEEIRSIREELDLSQGEFAEELGVSAGTVSNWERDINKPGPKAIQNIRKLRP